jgi:hypothetical protein
MSQNSSDTNYPKDILQILARIDKLSNKPQNPGLAYQNLATIKDLIKVLVDKLQ